MKDCQIIWRSKIIYRLLLRNQKTKAYEKKKETKFILEILGKKLIKSNDRDVRRSIYKYGVREQQYSVDEITDDGEIENSYIYKYKKEGLIFRKQTYSRWKTLKKQFEQRQLNLFTN
uniref:Uncharacterized protein n=1 Tax=Dulem virus 201 TaxID=3145678 RepID=A0AAU8AXI0_9VIRU